MFKAIPFAGVALALLATTAAAHDDAYVNHGGRVVQRRLLSVIYATPEMIESGGSTL